MNKQQFLENFKKLSFSEKQVFFYLLEAKPTKQIADEIKRSFRTVEFHRYQIFKKFGVSSLPLLLTTYNRILIEFIQYFVERCDPKHDEIYFVHGGGEILAKAIEVLNFAGALKSEKTEG